MVALMLLLPTEATTEEKMNTCRTFYRPTTAHIPLKTTIYSQKFGFVPHILYLRFVTQIAGKEETGKSQMERGQWVTDEAGGWVTDKISVKCYK